jgi:hypothetical protein
MIDHDASARESFRQHAASFEWPRVAAILLRELQRRGIDQQR